MKRIPGSSTFLGMTTAGASVYVTSDGIITKKQRKRPFHTTVTMLLAHLHRLSPGDYETFRRGARELSLIFVDPRLPGWPTWEALHYERRYRFKPVEKYFETADELVRQGRVI